LAVLAPPILQLNLNLKQAADATVLLTIVDATGSPITNTTGFKIRAQIRVNPGNIVLFEWNTTPGPGIGTALFTYSSDLVASTVMLILTAAQTALFNWGSAQWDCILTNPAGLSTFLAEGIITIDPAITM
jgi:hypothetical protein